MANSGKVSTLVLTIALLVVAATYLTRFSQLFLLTTYVDRSLDLATSQLRTANETISGLNVKLDRICALLEARTEWPQQTKTTSAVSPSSSTTPSHAP